MKLYEYMGYELIEKVKEKEFKIQEILKAVLTRIEETEPKIHSFVNLSKIES